jgi:hypothetical protein
MRKAEILGMAEMHILNHAIKFCHTGGYCWEEDPLLLEIKNEVEKIDTANRDEILEYVLGDSYKQRDKTLYITSQFENRYFFTGYKDCDRINEDKHKRLLISAIYCYRTASIPVIEPSRIRRRSKSFWQNLTIDWLNAEQEFIEKTSQLTEMDVFFICLDGCQQAYKNSKNF